MKRLLATVLTVNVVGLALNVALAPGSHAVTVSPCAVHTALAAPPAAPITVTAWVGTGCVTPPHVSIAEWSATSADGRPLTSQRRVAVGYDAPLPAAPGVASWTLPDTGPCYAQLDVAYGTPPADLSTPYGAALIAAWHFGVIDCLTSPTPPAPTPTGVPTPSGVPTSPPAPSSPATTTQPSVVVTTPPATGPVPSPTTPAVTLAPPVRVSKTPAPKVSAPTPTPTSATPSRTHTPSPTPAATTTPPRAELPYTGLSVWRQVLIGVGVLLLGLALLGAALIIRRRA